jgi:hypothetical protein
MNLPGRLRASTLGDLLGGLHRARLSGVLALRELAGTTAGKVHRVHLRGGLVVAIETIDGGRALPTGAVGDMTREEVQGRLEGLYRLTDAELTFHVASQRASEASEPLRPADFLHGRPRARDRGVASRPVRSPRVEAFEVLGLSPDATGREIQQAFRALALRFHPDRHPHVDEPTRTRLAQRFARLTRAYHLLVA